MATRLMKPGMLFQAAPLPYPGQGGLEATMSTYGIVDLEGAPQKNATYVVCRDGSVQNHWNRALPIGWALMEKDDGWYYRVTQMNHDPKPLAVFYMGTTEDIPAGRGFIGSMVMVAVAREPASPQRAEISEQSDSGEEVTSPPPAPVKARRSSIRDLGDITRNLNPDLARLAARLDDPEQTAALASFGRGEMSYAQMRSLCG